MRGDLVEPWEIVLSASIERTRRCKKGTKMKLDFKFKWFWSLTCARHADGLYLHILPWSSMSLCLGPRRSLELVVIGIFKSFLCHGEDFEIRFECLGVGECPQATWRRASGLWSVLEGLWQELRFRWETGPGGSGRCTEGLRVNDGHG